MERRPHALLLQAVLLLPLSSAPLGGWATVTVDDLPDYIEAGKPLTLSFMVRQHGVEPMKGVHPTLDARNGGALARAAAEPGSVAGRYVAVLPLKQPGDWTITIHSGHGNSKLTLLPIRAIPAGTPAPAAPATEERGRRLLVSKGCVGCHTRAEADVGGGGDIGPVLTGKRWRADFLGKFLADPAANATHTGSFRMPNLALKQAEIAYLAAFLNASAKSGTP